MHENTYASTYIHHILTSVCRTILFEWFGLLDCCSRKTVVQLTKHTAKRGRAVKRPTRPVRSLYVCRAVKLFRYHCPLSLNQMVRNRKCRMKSLKSIVCWICIARRTCRISESQQMVPYECQTETSSSINPNSPTTNAPIHQFVHDVCTFTKI